MLTNFFPEIFVNECSGSGCWFDVFFFHEDDDSFMSCFSSAYIAGMISELILYKFLGDR